ncbi:MAG: hypothetical protein IPG23_25015 [Burkholderiales bacterium]|nr:hypothetical protein [Burkholderiales bacterium]
MSLPIERLAALPGVDLSQGLRVLLGNTVKYCELLRRFTQSHGDELDTLRAALKAAIEIAATLPAGPGSEPVPLEIVKADRQLQLAVVAQLEGLLVHSDAEAIALVQANSALLRDALGDAANDVVAKSAAVQF